MSRNSTHIDASPEQVFAVLTDASAYSDWVVGAKRVRSVDDDWPKPGSRFHHAMGAGAAEVKDSTKVLEIDEPRRLVLEVKGRPVGVGKVELDVEPEGDGTLVTLVEHPVEGPVAVLFNPVMDLLLKGRNVESLRRLKELAESR